MVSTEWRDQTHVHSYMDAWNSGRIYSFSLPLSPYSATEFFFDWELVFHYTAEATGCCFVKLKSCSSQCQVKLSENGVLDYLTLLRCNNLFDMALIL